MPESESYSILRFGLGSWGVGNGRRDGPFLYYGEPDICQEGKRKGNSYPGAGRGVAYLTPYTPAFRSPRLVPSGLVAAAAGLDPLGSPGLEESEEPDAPRSVPKPRQGACLRRTRPTPTCPGRSGRGWGCGRIRERREPRARAAGTWVLAPEQRVAAQRIPHIPARPRFRRHVVALRAALTVRLGEGAHSTRRSA